MCPQGEEFIATFIDIEENRPKIEMLIINHCLHEMILIEKMGKDVLGL